MGYDVTFQLIDPKAVEAMLERLVAGAPPPPGPFDQRTDAPEIWAQARARVLGDDPVLAARTLGQLVAIWSAAWIERAKGPSVDRAALRDAVGRFTAGDGSPESVVALMTIVARAVEDEAPSPELGAEARRAFERVFDRLYDKPIPSEVAAAIGDAWCALHARVPGSSIPFTSWQVSDPGPASRMLEGVLRGASSSEALLSTVALVLKSFDAWVFAEDDTWGTSFVDAHREVLWALIDLGLSSADAQSQASARALWSAAFYREPRLVTHLERTLERGDVELAGELAERIPMSAATEAALGDAWIRLCIATREAPWFGSELVESGHAPALVRALERYAGRVDCEPKTAVAVAMAMSAQCTENGAYAEAAAVVDVALTVAPPASAADLLFNQACAHAKRGDGSQAARALGRAAELDPRQLLDALKDHDFDAVRAHPEVAALFDASVDPRALMLKCGAEARAALEAAVALAMSSSHSQVGPAHLLDRLLQRPDAATWAREQDLTRLRPVVAASLAAQPRSGGQPTFARSLVTLLLHAFAGSTGERITPPDIVACALRDPSAFGLAR